MSRVLLMGVSRFGHTVDADEEPETGARAWADLPFVEERMPRLEQAYRKLAYEVTAVANPDRGAVLAHTDAALDGGHRIIHVISHGHTRLSDRGRSRDAELGDKLDMVPSCGRTGLGTDVVAWVRTAHGAPEPMLFIVDLCGAGRAARVGALIDVPEDELHAWVIAATGPNDPTYDGLFSEAVAETLERVAANGLDTDETLRHVRWDRLVNDIRLRLSALGATTRLRTTKVDLGSPLPDLPFFPNPNWRPDPRRERLMEVVPPARAFVADLDAEHFIDRVRGHFVGRRTLRSRLAPWLDDPYATGLCVVTGAPGCGKSALLASLVCAAHKKIIEAAPDIRDYLRAQHPEGVPSPNDALVAIHARGRGLEEIAAAVAEQLGFADEAVTPAELVAHIQRMETPPPLVFDALDEADNPGELVDRLLLPLAKGACKLLVGTRRSTRFEPLLAAAQDMLIDLDEVDPGELRADLEQHLGQRLEEVPGYQSRTVRAAMARAVAAALTDDVSRRRGWGAFLVARIYGRALESLPVPGDAAAAERLGGSVPRTLPGVLELDLRLRPDGGRLRAVLATLAWAKGDGFPADVAAAVVPEFAPGLTESEVRPLLEAGRFYIWTGVDHDGCKLFRLFHQGLADYLQDHPYEPGDIR
ncbi:hypothetical protein GCM10009555_091490 [Acrocarpospora macrocephala]|uniref:Nephrocystin 3-like N-terminal domain-containing protein n=1 Tax=Acrocarpospora macrocephala TaxID=150177 RepID=A0A5M3WIW8_9ACTN|nr:hypothetical protein [Acrocarpospora macrocephala]GES09125.1 hypothetical protein Amac_027210 [Acrocarpospora macrocephala]